VGQGTLARKGEAFPASVKGASFQRKVPMLVHSNGGRDIDCKEVFLLIGGKSGGIFMDEGFCRGKKKIVGSSAVLTFLK